MLKKHEEILQTAQAFAEMTPELILHFCSPINFLSKPTKPQVCLS